jgi:hypothetical protein
MPAGSLYVQLPLEVLTDDQLSAGAKLFHAHLLRWDWGNGCWFTDNQLARELDMSVRSVRNHTKALEDAGHLWVFEDREGMTVRLVVRAGRAYPKPKGLGAPTMRKKSSTPSCARKDFIFYNKIDFEVHETTNNLPDPVLEELVDQETVDTVVTEKPQNLIEETLNELPETNPEVVEEIPVLESLSPIVEILQDVGVAVPMAQTLACKHSVGRIEAAVTYAKGYRGELLNKPGYVVSALQNGWKLPKWCYKPEMPQTIQEPPSEARSMPDPTIVPLDWESRRQKSPYADLWSQVCTVIQSKIQPQSFETWIQPCYISEISEDTVMLAAPNKFVAEWVEEHYLWLVRISLRDVNEGIQEIRIAEPTSDLISI